MTASIPMQRTAGLTRREQAQLAEILAKASIRLRFAQLSAKTDMDDAQEQVENICLYVTRELARLLGPQRCAVLDQASTFREIGEAVIAGAALVKGVR